MARWRQRVWQVVHAARTDPVFVQARAAQLAVQAEQLAVWGWHALRARDQAKAERYFRAALHYDPYTLGAWIGLSRATASRIERRTCLQAAFDLHFLVDQVARSG